MATAYGNAATSLQRMSRRGATLLAAAVFLFSALVVDAVNGSPLSPKLELGQTLARRATGINYTDPTSRGGLMKTIIPNLDGIGEPLNLIVSGESDASVLTVEGFLLWVTSINFGVSCLGQANGTQQSANLGYGDQIQGTGDGNNGVLRWNYYSPYIGTCKETVQGGNHFRWFKQQDSNAYFLAASVELSLDTSHMIAQNGYNNGRDRIVGNATLSNGTEWQGNVYNTTVEWVEAGVLLNATSDGINHPSVALEGQPSQDGRVAVLTVRQLQSGSSNGATAAAHLSLAHGFVALVLAVATATVLTTQ